MSTTSSPNADQSLEEMVLADFYAYSPAQLTSMGLIDLAHKREQELEEKAYLDRLEQEAAVYEKPKKPTVRGVLGIEKEYMLDLVRNGEALPIPEHLRTLRQMYVGLQNLKGTPLEIFELLKPHEIIEYAVGASYIKAGKCKPKTHYMTLALPDLVAEFVAVGAQKMGYDKSQNPKEGRRLKETKYGKHLRDKPYQTDHRLKTDYEGSITERVFELDDEIQEQARHAIFQSFVKPEERGFIRARKEGKWTSVPYYPGDYVPGSVKEMSRVKHVLAGYIMGWFRKEYDLSPETKKKK